MRVPIRPLVLGVCALLAGCDGATNAAVDASRCEVPDYLTALSGNIDRIEVWAGNRHGLAAEALLVIEEPDAVSATSGFFKDRSDHWFIGAGETYDPATRRSGSAFTLKFMRDLQQQAYIGLGYNYLESPGCGFEVVRVLPASDHPLLNNLVFGAPLPE